MQKLWFLFGLLFLLPVVSSAADKVVVVPLSSNPVKGQTCSGGGYVSGFDENGNIICHYPPRFVFLTSNTYNGNFGGVEGADMKCNFEAWLGHLSGKYKAWISDGTSSPSTRFTKYKGDYLNLERQVVANGWEDLTDGTLDNRIVAMPNAAAYYGYVWTSTAPDGTPLGDNHCNGWTSADSSYFGGSGYTNSVSSTWTNSTVWNCQSSVRLYCFEDY